MALAWLASYRPLALAAFDEMERPGSGTPNLDAIPPDLGLSAPLPRLVLPKGFMARATLEMPEGMEKRERPERPLRRDATLALGLEGT